MSQPTSAMKGTGKSAITERAITSIQQWPPKGSCIIKGVSTPEFYATTDELQSLCEEYQLTLEFYSKDKVLAFCRMLSPIEASIQPWLATEIQRMQEERFTRPSHWYHRITQNYSMEFRGFNGDHQWSRKAPNVSIQSVGRTMPNLVVEVAFSETCEHARRKAHLWLESSNICRVVILVTINESEPPCSMLVNVPRIPIPEGYSLCEDDDDWVGDLQVSIEVARKGADGIYNECELHLADVTRNESRMAELSRGYESDDSTHDEHAQGSQGPGTPGPDGPKLTIKRSDIYGDRIPRSLGGDDTFEISTDSLRGFMAQYRRDLGRDRRLPTAFVGPCEKSLIISLYLMVKVSLLIIWDAPFSFFIGV